MTPTLIAKESNNFAARMNGDSLWRGASIIQYASIEGELLGIALALHKCSYFILGHPRMKIVTDHKPIVHFRSDKSQTVENKRLNNLRHKCEDFQFTCHYSKVSDNLDNSISRIDTWSETDTDRFPTVSDHEDEVFRINCTKIERISEAQVIRQEYKIMKTAQNTLRDPTPSGKKPNRLDQKRIVEDSWHTSGMGDTIGIGIVDQYFDL